MSTWNSSIRTSSAAGTMLYFQNHPPAEVGLVKGDALGQIRGKDVYVMKMVGDIPRPVHGGLLFSKCIMVCCRESMVGGLLFRQGCGDRHGLPFVQNPAFRKVDVPRPATDALSVRPRPPPGTAPGPWLFAQALGPRRGFWMLFARQDLQSWPGCRKES